MELIYKPLEFEGLKSGLWSFSHNPKNSITSRFLIQFCIAAVGSSLLYRAISVNEINSFSSSPISPYAAIQNCSFTGGNGNNIFERVCPLQLGWALAVVPFFDCFQYKELSIKYFKYRGHNSSLYLVRIKYPAYIASSGTVSTKYDLPTVPPVRAKSISFSLSKLHGLWCHW